MYELAEILSLRGAFPMLYIISGDFEHLDAVHVRVVRSAPTTDGNLARTCGMVCGMTDAMVWPYNGELAKGSTRAACCTVLMIQTPPKGENSQ